MALTESHSSHVRRTLRTYLRLINGSEGEFWSEDPSDVSHKYAQYVVAPANQCLDTAGTLFKVAVLVDGGDRFVLVSSLSHILGDGHTYYVCEYTPWAR